MLTLLCHSKAHCCELNNGNLDKNFSPWTWALLLGEKSEVGVGLDMLWLDNLDILVSFKYIYIKSHREIIWKAFENNKIISFKNNNISFWFT
jgi:hypothetical protein